MKLAIVFEESWAYQYKETKKQQRGEGSSGLQAGFEEDFSFGEEDDADYWDRPDITEGRPIE